MNRFLFFSFFFRFHPPEIQPRRSDEAGDVLEGMVVWWYGGGMGWYGGGVVVR